MIILKGAEVSAKIRDQVHELLKELDGKIPRLAIVRVGEKPDDLSYERGAIKKITAFGMEARSYAFPEDVDNEEFQKEFRKINEDPEVSGILLLKPLPDRICQEDLDRIIDPSKDLDGISPVNIAKVFAGDGSGFAPCTAEAVVETLRPLREESLRIMQDKAYLESVYKAGTEKASYVANKTMRKVKKKIGLVAEP